MSSVPISEEDLKREMEDLKEDLQCAVCLDILKKPIMILPCLHSFCSPCIQAHASSSSSSSSSSLDSASSPSKCPVCRQEFSASEGGKRGMQGNPFLESQVERLEELRKSLLKLTLNSVDIDLCDVCDQSNRQDASVRCLDCKENLCEGCNKHHSRYNKTHKVVDISEASDHLTITSSSPAQHPPCPNHPTKELDLMCLECEVPICSFCAFVEGDHQNHKASPISHAINQEKRKLSELVESVEDRRSDLDKSLSAIEHMEIKIQESLISQKAKIISFCDDLKNEIDQKQEELLDELETKSKAKLEKLAQQRKRLEANLSCLENSVKVSKSFIKNASDVQLSSHLSILSDQLTRLKEDKSLLQPPSETRCLELNEGSNFGDLLKAIKLSEMQPSSISELLKGLRMPRAFNLVPRELKSIGKPSLVFGSNGSGKGQFNGPRGIAIDRNNRIIVSEWSGHRIQIFDEEGVHLQTIGSQGNGNGQFGCPYGVAVDHNNRIIVCEYSYHRVQIFDEEGVYLQTIGSQGKKNGQFRCPYGVAVDQDNRIIVCDTENNRIQIFGDQGNHLKTFGSKGTGIGEFNKPQGVAVDQNNRIIVSENENHRVQIFDDQGNHLLTFGSKGSGNGQFSQPEGVAVDHNNRIIVCDWGGHRAQIFDDQGNHLKTFGSLSCPSGVAVDLDNRILFCENAGNKVQVF